ncbi:MULTISPECIES: MlaD family protein [unclassified Gordonia (in: high G+C Gram-positive bacteria)]|uniref:MlaD family protein n=1 Tax=unclassified Gordonia (in: high G+C Gram-positive bacteria) TaxID=2657482 RepID=UPI0020002D3A|nr:MULTISPECIES: MlaD family protein [unclassified Gordonia (in: high G+C Gram-positive bacteria)]UQE73550.1 MlaD family protein [Gordonia sp. PP30]
MNRIKKAALGAVAVLTAVSLTACSSLPGITVEQIPLPSPGGLGSTYQLKAVFDNALNLPSQAKVRLNGTDVGEVTGIVAKNYQAEVTMDISDTTKLPVGTGAELRQATPLGDVFVALNPPRNADKGMMSPGQTLSGETSAAATVEDLLISMTAQVDSGSVSALQNIFTELSTALSGQDKYVELQGAINGFTTAITKFNKNSAEVDTAMANTQKLTGELADGRNQITAAVNKLPPAIATVNDELGLILDTLDKSNTVTAATANFLNTRQSDLIELLGHLNEAAIALNQTAPQLTPLMQRLFELNPKWKGSTPGSAAAVAAKLYWLTPGVGFDSRSRFPELQDLQGGLQSLQQTLTIVLARLTGQMGAN